MLKYAIQDIDKILKADLGFNDYKQIKLFFMSMNKMITLYLTIIIYSHQIRRITMSSNCTHNCNTCSTECSSKEEKKSRYLQPKDTTSIKKIYGI